MTTHKSNTDIKTNFSWNDIFHPKGDDLIRIRSHLLASQYLKQIEQVLDNKKIIQKNLAREIGVSPSYLSQLFSGNKLPNWKTLAKIELALNITFELMPSMKNDKYTPSIPLASSFSKRESFNSTSINDDCVLKIA